VEGRLVIDLLVTSEPAYVVVSFYQPPGEKPPVVHVWGPWPTRNKAVTAKGRMHREQVRAYGKELANQVGYRVRQVLNPEQHQ
jgi:hypothetical protein